MTITVSGRSFQQELPLGPKVRPNPKSITVCTEGQIVVSKNGLTSIYTGGFAQCLGLAIATPDNQGGLVAHVKQMGKRLDTLENDETYFTRWCVAIIDRAVVDLNSQQFYVALYKGFTSGVGWNLGLAGDPRVISVLDLRGRSHLGIENSELLFDTAKRKLYIPVGLSNAQVDAACEIADTHQNAGEVSNDLAKSSMPVFHVA